MKNLFKKHKYFWLQKSFRWNVIFSIFLLFLSLLINYYANAYTALRASNPVTDIILDNIPVFDVDFFFVQGFVILWIFIAFLQFKEPKNIPFVLKSIALFLFIRSIFISLTHMGAPINHLEISPYKIILDLTSGNDLFFSSHTGLPFLMALIYWDNKKLKYIFLATTVFFAAVVLMAHLHYSIDVFGALFITYTIFHIAKKLFPKDYKTLETNDLELL